MRYGCSANPCRRAAVKPSRFVVCAVVPLAVLLLGTSAALGRAVPGPEPRRDCSDPGWRVVACEALRDSLPLANGGAPPCPGCALRPRAPATP
jgi:hypothetical protein